MPSPKADSASRRAPASGLGQVVRADSTMRMPRPPPPADALTSSGQPRASTASASGGASPSTVIDGSVGHPGGPHHVLGPDLGAHGVDGVGRRARPRRGRRRRTARAKSPDSERKP